MADTTDEQRDEQAEEQSLSDRLLDLFVFLPTGVVVTVAEELPRLAERGRERLGVHVNSARAVGEFAVTAGGQELKRRSAARSRPAAAPDRDGSRRGPGPTGADAARTARTGTTRLRTIPYPEDRRPPTATAAGRAVDDQPRHRRPAPLPLRPRPPPRHRRAAAAPAAPTPRPDRRPTAGRRTRPRRGQPGHPRVRHAVRLPGGPAPRRAEPVRAGGRPGLRDVDPRAAHHPQPGRPAAGRAVLSRS